MSKCEAFLFGGSEDERTEVASVFAAKYPMLQQAMSKKLVYLGAPLLDVAFERCFRDTAGNALLLAQKTEILPAHHALFLIKNCLGPIKLCHLLRTCRAFLFPGLLTDFDEQMRVRLATIVNADIADTSWNQASLPVSLGGLGIRQTNALALPASLASAHSVYALAQGITHFDLGDYLKDAIERWNIASENGLRTVERSLVR